MSLTKLAHKEISKLKGSNLSEICRATGFSYTTMYRLVNLRPSTLKLQYIEKLEETGHIQLNIVDTNEHIKLKEAKWQSDLRLMKALTLLKDARDNVLPKMKCDIEAYHAKENFLKEIEEVLND
jgi:hypothetical protein